MTLSLLLGLILWIKLPVFIDGLATTAILVVLPTLVLYYVFNLLFFKLGDNRGKASLIFTGLIVAVLLAVVSSLDWILLLMTVGAVGITLLLWKNRPALWGIAALLCLFFLFTGHSQKVRDGCPKLLIVGIDSATPSIIDTMRAKGYLENIDRLIKQGAYGGLLSEEPTFSPALWTTIATGVSRETHGITSFYHTAAAIKAPRLWEILQQNGWSVGVFRWMVSWPPVRMNGFIVPDLLARDDTSFPPGYGVMNTISDALHTSAGFSVIKLTRQGWRLLETGLSGATARRLLAKGIKYNFKLRDYNFKYMFLRESVLEAGSDIFLRLVKKHRPEAAVYYDNGVDVVCHSMWKYSFPDGFRVTSDEVDKYGGFVSDIYRYNDRVLGKLLKSFDDSIDVIVLSDHGMERVKDEEIDYFWVDVDNLFETLGLEDKAYSQSLHKHQFIYPVGEVDEAGFYESVAETLKRLRFENGAHPFVLNVDVSGHTYIKNVSEAGEGGLLYLDDKPAELEDYLTKAFSISAYHALVGTIVMRGRNIPPGSVVEGASIYDVAPTILAWQGFPLGSYMEGRPLTGVFSAEPELQFTDSYVRNEDFIGADVEGLSLDKNTKDKLRAMGYVK